MDKTLLSTLHKLSIDNRASIKKSQQVGCFFCLRIMVPTNIKNWCLVNNINRNPDCAICPHCSIDSILPDNDCKENGVEFGEKILKDLREMYFGWYGLKGEEFKKWVEDNKM